MKKVKANIPDRKICELVASHGPIITELLAEQLSAKELGNFYGRTFARQSTILENMRCGSSYSRAYKRSESCFDTKNWAKVSNRTAAARGLLLKAAAHIYCRRTHDVFTPDEILVLQQMADQLSQEALNLSRRILQCDLREVPVSKRCKKQEKTLDPTALAAQPFRFSTIQGWLKTAITKTKKTSRDVPQMVSQLGELPTVQVVAHTLVEVARIVRGVPLFKADLDSQADRSRVAYKDDALKDSWGIGREYSVALTGLPVGSQPTRRVATHSRPDADALVAAWIAERFLFPAEVCQIEFVDGRFVPSKSQPYNCVVDVGCSNDPDQLFFDHKPPAFADRNVTCAAKLIWEHVRTHDRAVPDVSELVELVHDGDAITRRSRSQRYAASRQTGLHALINHARAYCTSDQMLYQFAKVYLDNLACRPA